MRILILILFMMVFDSNADFSVGGIKNWFKEIYNNGSSKIETELNSFKSSTAGTKIKDFLNETRTTYQENRVVDISPEFLKARKNFADYAAKLNKELDADIQSLNQLEDIQYHDRIVIYKDGMQYVSYLEECLAKEVKSLSDARLMKREASDHMDNILNILTDELIYSYVDDLREAYHAFNNAFTQAEKELKNKQKNKQ